jgi:xanthine dehydrogenase/oxidase
VASASALACLQLHRPVRIAMPRDVDSYMIGHRHPFLGSYNIAVVPEGPDKGKILGTVYEFYSNGGNTVDCSFDVMDCAVLGSDNCYMVENFQTEGFVCRTNRTSNGAMRSYGGVQSGLICEESIEVAAFKIGMLPEDLREKNFYVVGDKTPYGQSLDYCIIREVWDHLRKKSDFDNRVKAVEKFNAENRWKKRGISMMD